MPINRPTTASARHRTSGELPLSPFSSDTLRSDTDLQVIAHLVGRAGTGPRREGEPREHRALRVTREGSGDLGALAVVFHLNAPERGRRRAQGAPPLVVASTRTVPPPPPEQRELSSPTVTSHVISSTTTSSRASSQDGGVVDVYVTSRRQRGRTPPRPWRGRHRHGTPSAASNPGHYPDHDPEINERPGRPSGVSHDRLGGTASDGRAQHDPPGELASVSTPASSVITRGGCAACSHRHYHVCLSHRPRDDGQTDPRLLFLQYASELNPKGSLIRRPPTPSASSSRTQSGPDATDTRSPHEARGWGLGCELFAVFVIDQRLKTLTTAARRHSSTLRV